MLYLDRDETSSLIDRDALRRAVGVAMAELSAGNVSMPDRVGAFTPDGVMAVMPAYVPALDAMATKLVTVFPGNATLGISTHQGVVLLVDPTDGSVIAMLDGEVITAERTAAGSALSVDLLGRADARVLTVMGTGEQAASHLHHVTRVRPFAEVRVWGRSEDRARALVDRIVGELGTASVTAVRDGEAAVTGADVVCLTTDSPDPVIDRRWIAPGAHVTSVGFSATGRELDTATVADATLVVEGRATALADYPVGSHDLGIPFRDGVIGPDDLHAEIGELVSGTVAGRTSDDELTLYKSSGVAVQDVAAAKLIYDEALRRGVGTRLPAD